jgi:hypothetical protein
LAFGIQRIEREAALPRAARTGEDHEPILRKHEALDIEVVLARADDFDHVRRVTISGTQAHPVRPFLTHR